MKNETSARQDSARLLEVYQCSEPITEELFNRLVVQAVYDTPPRPDKVPLWPLCAPQAVREGQ